MASLASEDHLISDDTHNNIEMSVSPEKQSTYAKSSIFTRVGNPFSLKIMASLAQEDHLLSDKHDEMQVSPDKKCIYIKSSVLSVNFVASVFYFTLSSMVCSFILQSCSTFGNLGSLVRSCTSVSYVALGCAACCYIVFCATSYLSFIRHLKSAANMAIALVVLFLFSAPILVAGAFMLTGSRILFVGDSLTFTHDGMHEYVKYLAASRAPVPRILLESLQATEGGATLKSLWEREWPRETIEDASPMFNTVVLQDDIPEYKLLEFTTDGMDETFFKYCRLFCNSIRSAGGNPVLYMAWAYERLPWVSMEQIAQAHRNISKELGIKVAPVGLAFQRSLAINPSIVMLGMDNEHETVAGSYLGACVIYFTIFGETNVLYRPHEISERDAAFLRRIAQETVKAWDELG